MKTKLSLFFQAAIYTRIVTFSIVTLLITVNPAISDTKIVDKSCKYKDIPINTAYKNECSPVIFEDNFIGVKIKAPKKIRVSQAGDLLTEKGSLIPIAGYYNIPLSDLIKDANIQVFVENIKTGKKYSAPLLDRNNAKLMANRAKDFSKEKLHEQTFGSYINPNLSKYLELPNNSAKYEVRVVVGKFESNIVRIDINADDDFIPEW